NKAAAIAFLEFLTEEKAQHLYGEINFEYPVNPAVSVSGELASWGRFKPDSLPIGRLAVLASKAQMIIDRVGW
ncbi:iron ABC transporter substrate-binding protein, partial [Alphaproteobacteria bacterium]|nr:iron ABC transporter substrate-binding protein [Alphaproteobacteria bacterium]